MSSSGQNTNSANGTLGYDTAFVPAAGNAGSFGESQANGGGGGQGANTIVLIASATIGASQVFTAGNGGTAGNGSGDGSAGAAGTGGLCRITEFFG
jgi:hypothetical protein